MKSSSLLGLFVLVSVLLLSGFGGEKNVEKGNILGGKASIVLPEKFVRMPEDMLAKKYARAQRPKEAWYAKNENGKVSLAFSMTENAMQEFQLLQFAQMMKNQLNAFSPSLSEEKVNGRKMIRMEMKTPDGNDPTGKLKIINVMQLSSLDGKLLISTFNVTEDLQGKYLAAGKSSLSTLSY